MKIDEAKRKVCPLLPCDRIAEPSKVQGVPPRIALIPSMCMADKCMMWLQTMGPDDGICSLRSAGYVGSSSLSGLQ